MEDQNLYRKMPENGYIKYMNAELVRVEAGVKDVFIDLASEMNRGDMPDYMVELVQNLVELDPQRSKRTDLSCALKEYIN